MSVVYSLRSLSALEEIQKRETLRNILDNRHYLWDKVEVKSLRPASDYRVYLIW